MLEGIFVPGRDPARPELGYFRLTEMGKQRMRGVR
jgi:hypothetical protein